MTVSTFNAYHLGDNLVHLNFLRKCAQAHPEHAFLHHANPQHAPQLAPLVADLDNLSLSAECPDGAVNAWRGAGGFFYGHEKRNDFVAFHMDWFHHLAMHMGLPESPITGGGDLLFDYPALRAPESQPHHDYLVINSAPHSGQLRGYNPNDFVELVRMLVARGKSVITTAPTGLCDCTNDGAKGLDVTGIGKLSQSVGCIVGVATGPIWPCFNIWNTTARFVVLLDNERLDLTPTVTHVGSCAEALKFL